MKGLKTIFLCIWEDGAKEFSWLRCNMELESLDLFRQFALWILLLTHASTEGGARLLKNLPTMFLFAVAPRLGNAGQVEQA
jgi:hypothetical protein